MSEEHTNPFDITLVVKDGKEFQAHRNVLLQASPFFEKLLRADMKENNEGVIRLEWITESQMAEILQFIYTCNVQISSQENAENLIATADYLLLSNLKTIAGKFLEQHITTVNCIVNCEIPRPHSPRNSLKTSVIVISDVCGKVNTCFYLPATDEWYRLPAIEGKPEVHHIISCRGKLFAVTGDITRSQCYDPDLNRWSPAPWTKLDSSSYPQYEFQKVLVVKNKICFIAQEFGSTALWTYSFDSNSLTPLFNWVKKSSFCAVAVDRYIYVIGGTTFRGSYLDPTLSECTRFDTEADEWQKIAPLNEARQSAFGVCKNGKMFIAGGFQKDGRELLLLKTCEVYEHTDR
ncbi:hypothetical protein ACROYT_G025733 [Oculina patagonica]